MDLDCTTITSYTVLFAPLVVECRNALFFSFLLLRCMYEQCERLIDYAYSDKTSATYVKHAMPWPPAP